jgi:2-polyprenyl-3-methyl-5-hydroxy-6-metoxy-1,4-benzoquinol methylase
VGFPSIHRERPLNTLYVSEKLMDSSYILRAAPKKRFKCKGILQMSAKPELRFEFGENWKRFLGLLDDDRIQRAEQSLCQMLDVSDLKGKAFIDIGSGSGLFSLAARRLGARVFSFDYDLNSVACTQELRRRFFPNDENWQVEQGSVLDTDYLGKLGQFDVVYSWGVLHHTGSMWDALANVVPLVKPSGRLFIAIYNDQGKPSLRWSKIKRAYLRMPQGLKWIVLWPSFLHLWWKPLLKDILMLRPMRSWRNYSGLRGMDPWRDVVDWVGGYPFEVAMPEEIFNYYRDCGFELRQLKTQQGALGCVEYVFVRR